MITFQGTNSNIATLSAIPDISSHHPRMVEREVVVSRKWLPDDVLKLDSDANCSALIDSLTNRFTHHIMLFPNKYAFNRTRCSGLQAMGLDNMSFTPEIKCVSQT